MVVGIAVVMFVTERPLFRYVVTVPRRSVVQRAAVNATRLNWAVVGQHEVPPVMRLTVVAMPGYRDATVAENC